MADQEMQKFDIWKRAQADNDKLKAREGEEGLDGMVKECLEKFTREELNYGMLVTEWLFGLNGATKEGLLRGIDHYREKYGITDD